MHAVLPVMKRPPAVIHPRLFFRKSGAAVYSLLQVLLLASHVFFLIVSCNRPSSNLEGSVWSSKINHVF